MPSTTLARLKLFFRLRNRLAIVSACCLVAQFSFFLSGCGKTLIPAAVPINYSLEIRDPVLRKFTQICQCITVAASGSLKKGKVDLHGIPVSAEDDTTFALSLTLPITDPERISMSTATGVLTVSKPITLGGVPLPQKIVLEPGKATGQVDLLGTLGMFIVNIIANKPLQDAGGKNAGSLINTVSIQTAQLDLTPGAALDLGALHLNLAPGSRLTLKDLTFDQNLNYTGKIDAALHFSKGCKYAGKKADFEFDSGTADLHLQATKQDNLISLKLDAKTPPVDLSTCTYRFGKVKQCKAEAKHGTLAVREFTWQKVEGGESVDLKSKSAMTLQSSSLLLKNPKGTFTLSAQFPRDIPAWLEVDRTKDGATNNWWTETTNEASKVTMEITPGKDVTSVLLGRTAIGPVSLSKEGDLEFSFKKGVSEVKKVEWSNGKKSFRLSCASGSTMSIPPGTSMSFLKDEEGSKTHLPLSLNLGKATISGTKSSVDLSDLKGKVTLTVDHGTRLTGNLDFALVDSELLGQHKIEVKTHDIELITKKTGSEADLKDCSMSVSNQALAQMINEQLPNEKTFEVDKQLIEKQKWCYRNARLTKVTMTNLAVKELHAIHAGEEQFTVTGDVAVEGTVEKTAVLSLLINKSNAKWELRPWSATGSVVGNGDVKYTIVARTPVTDTEVDYELTLDLHPPEDVVLNWKAVSNGLLSNAESKVITKFIQSYDPAAFSRKATLKVFKKKPKSLNSVALQDITTAPISDGLRVDFAAELKL
jgi:hypothetical protein